jgi:GDP-mannose 6-dehydrogenase
MKIAIYGLGYVGLTAAVCLAKQGHTVIGVDVAQDKVRQINEGIAPLKEPGVEELLREAIALDRFECTTHSRDRVFECEMVIVCVGTPSAPDGSYDLRHIAEVSREIALATKSTLRTSSLTVVYRSTILPGTMEKLIYPIFHFVLGDDIGSVELVFNPEFLRETTAIHDYFNPPKIVIGTFDGDANHRMHELYKDLAAPLFYTKYREAEFTKIADNAFHALKVGYANEIGRACAQLGVNAAIVHKMFVSDTKLNISSYYCRPGGPFGGSCLPKDVRALQYISSDVGANMHLVEALMRTNEAHKYFLFQMVTKDLPPGAKILVLGLAFKSKSDDMRESPNVDLVRKLLQAGYAVSVFDKSIEPRSLIGQNLGYAFSNLPSLDTLIVSQEATEKSVFDVVVDANGTAATMSLASKRIINIHALV